MVFVFVREIKKGYFGQVIIQEGGENEVSSKYIHDKKRLGPDA